MRKLLVIVVAAVGLLAPFTVHAQAANLALYGRVNLDLEYIDVSGGIPGVTRLSSNSSRIGVRGSESLGGGTYAIFQIESSVFADAGGGTLAGRETFLGLTAPWGTLKFGNMLMPYDDMHPLFGNETTLTTSILSTSTLWANGTPPKELGGFDARLPNSIRYDTPNFNGLFGSVQVSLTENPSSDAYVMSMSSLYSNGPFSGAIAYERNEDVRADGLDDWAFTATMSWDFGVLRLAGVYERLDYRTPSGPLKRDLYGVSVMAPVGRGSLYAVWMHASDGKGGGSRVGGLSNGADTSSDQWEISYTYTLSRRVVAYAGIVRIANERNASYIFNINPYSPSLPPPLGMKQSGYVVGLVQFF